MILRHFTATVYVLFENKVLLLLHAKYGKWLPPGGHLEENETPPECAKREVYEETGLHVELLKEEHLWIAHENAASCERPFMCLIENIPERGNEQAHQHIDFIYLGKPIGGVLHPTPEHLRFFTWEEVRELKPEEIFTETRETIEVLLCIPLLIEESG